MPKTRTTLRIQHKTVGYMHYLMREGMANTVHGVLDEVMENYVQQYAKAYNLEIEQINEEAMYLYELTRRPKNYEERKKVKKIVEDVINEN